MQINQNNYIIFFVYVILKKFNKEVHSKLIYVKFILKIWQSLETCFNTICEANHKIHNFLLLPLDKFSFFSTISNGHKKWANACFSVQSKIFPKLKAQILQQKSYWKVKVLLVCKIVNSIYASKNLKKLLFLTDKNLMIDWKFLIFFSLCSKAWTFLNILIPHL